MERRVLKSPKMVDHFFDSPPTGLPVGFFVLGVILSSTPVFPDSGEFPLFSYGGPFPTIFPEHSQRNGNPGFSIGKADVTQGNTQKTGPLDRSVFCRCPRSPPESMRKAISRRNSSSGNSLRQQENTLRISSLFHAAEIREPQPGTASARNREWPRRRRHVPERQADPFRCRSPAYSKLQTPHPMKTPYLLSTLILHAPALLARHAETALPSHTIRIPMYAKPYLANPTPPLHRIDQFRPIFHT